MTLSTELSPKGLKTLFHATLENMLPILREPRRMVAVKQIGKKGIKISSLLLGNKLLSIGAVMETSC